MSRRRLLRTAAAIPFLSAPLSGLLAPAGSVAASPAKSRVRPGDPAWPSADSWEQLGRDVGGRLLAVRSPLDACRETPDGASCAELLNNLKNPYFLGDEPGLTQSLGWVDAWTSSPSAYAVAARTTGDVVAAVDFARHHDLRLVVKGGGHSYHGGSSAADSLLVWTRAMDAVTVHDAFVGAGCEGAQEPQPAVTVEAGAMWGRLYDTVTTGAGRYVQGGGCLTVGVAGLVLSGGFGSFSKAYGTAAASLLEAEIVTADGEVRIANACTHPDLFWALKGGGAGSLGVVTRLTLKTHQLPEFFGAVLTTIEARSDTAFRRLIGAVMGFYHDRLRGPQWGEQIVIRPDNVLAVQMVFQGLDQQQAEAVWRPFLERLAASSAELAVAEPMILAAPARHFWDPAFLKGLPGLVLADDRPGAPASNLFWAGNLGEAGQVLHGYQSAWLPAALLEPGRREDLCEALFAASRHWGVSLHANKGLAGAPPEVIRAAEDTATHPAVLDAFALLISGAEGPPAHPGIPGHAPDVAAARADAAAVDRAVGEVRKLLTDPGSYVAESDFFAAAWQDLFWGPNYPKLLAIKGRYDPDGLFFVHHGVGSERWSADGFTRQA